MHIYYTFSRLDLTIKGPFSKVSSNFFWQVYLKNLLKYNSFKFWHLFHQFKRVPCKPMRAFFRRTCSFQTADVSQCHRAYYPYVCSGETILPFIQEVALKRELQYLSTDLWYKLKSCSLYVVTKKNINVTWSWIDRLVIAPAKYILNRGPCWHNRCKNGQC